MKIVVLDGHTLHPGDLSWDDIKNLGETAFHERSARDEVIDRCFAGTASRIQGVSFDVLAEEESLTLTEIALRLHRTPGSTKDYLSWLEDGELVTSQGKR